MKKLSSRILVIMILLSMCLTVIPTVALAANVSVTYLDETGTSQTVTAAEITSSTATLGNGWYVVNSDVTRTGMVTVSGNAKLILADGKTFTVTAASGDYNAGINVIGTNSLTIYGQADGTGVLNATGSYYGAGIGGGGYQIANIACGTITINGGTVNAYGGDIGSGIGSGWYGIGGIITINGGTVTAKGGDDGAGIGGGSSSSGGTITINGGNVTATGGDSGAGIGGGGSNSGGLINISGGTIVAAGGIYGAGIGGGIYGSGGNIDISGGTVTATTKDNPWGGTGIGGGYDRDGGNISISGGTIIATGETCGAGIGGSGGGDGGIITISGGTVTATGDNSVWGGSPGIGCGTDGNGGSITLSGGVVFAQAGPGAMDVGGGARSGSPGTLEISNTAALFLKNNRFVTPTTTTHTNESISGHTADTAVYGIPVQWSGNFGAYLRLSTLSYDLNNGSGTLPPQITQHIGTSVSVSDDSTLSRTGYTISGWNTAANGGGSGYNAGDTFAFPENTTLFAAWTPHTYTINYNANGGSGSTASSNHTYGISKTLTDNSFTRTGYTFSGWATSAGGAAIYSGGQSVMNLTSVDGATLTLYAVWTVNSYTVSYNANGGSGSTASSSHTYGIAKTLTTNGFTRTGYTFTGWATEAGGTVVYSNGQSVTNLTLVNGATVTLYAVWMPHTYTVSYNANGGTGSTASSNHTYGVAKTLTANSYTRTGYTCVGWATSAGGAAVYSDEQNVSNLTPVNGATVTLYAAWTPHAYTVSYSANGGTGSTTSSSHTYGVAKNLTTNGFTKTGYTFAGWATSAGGGVVYSGGQSVLNLTSEDGTTLTLYAVWLVNTYTVSYNANGGSGSTALSSHTYDIAKTLTVNSFTRTGYTFAGWATSAGGAAVYSNGQSVTNLTPVNGATVTLYAVWTPHTYTVIYDANGGSGSTASSSHTYGTLKTLTDNNFTRTGYTFAGWATSAGGPAVYSNGQSVINITPVNGATMTLYAAWTPHTYAISYDANGGSGSTASSSHTYGVAKTLTASGFARTGYTFEGWTTDADGAAVYADEENVINLTPEDGAAITLYAVWTPHTYTVSYDANGGSGSTASSSHTYDDEKTLTDNNFTRTGYTFAGWATNADGASVYSNEQSVTNITPVNGATVTLYAAWTPHTYAISYDANGGSGSTASSSHTYDEAKTLTANGYTRTGYTFEGWAINADGAAVYTDKESVLNLTPEDDAEITLYAVWTPHTYTVSYDANGGSGSTASSSHTYNDAKTLTANDFIKTGYTFAGWATNADGAAVYTDEESVINLASEDGATVMLYAAWTPHTYTVSYDANGGSGSTATSSHTYGIAKTLTGNGFTRIGYTFAGWATDADVTVIYSDGQTVLNITPEDGVTVMLYAMWTTNSYTVSYDANGGLGSTASSSHTYDQIKTLTVNSFTRIGYTFAGWATSADSAVVYADKASVLNLTAMDGEVLVLYAVWAPHTYTVNYDAKGGSGSTASSNHTYGAAKTLTANGFTRTGYTFAGWAASANGAAIYTDKESVLNLTSVDGATVTLYAVWKVNTYIVNYNGNGGSGSTVSSGHTYGVAKPLTANGFTRTGYTFAGWAASANGAAIYSDKESVLNLTSENGATLTLNAVWKVNAYTVNYNANGGSGSTASSSHTYGVAKPLTANGFTRTGYTFTGWAASTNGAAIYMDEESVSNLTTENGVTVTLNAVWKVNAYTVNYNANGGSGSTASSGHTYGVAKPLTANGFTRTGYTFAGWATSANGADIYTDKESVLNLTTEDGATVTLNAVWKVNAYTVNYDANGGSGSTASSNHAYGIAKALQANGFTRTGYTFVGWAARANGAAIYSDEESVSNLTTENGAAVTLYAVWKANAYTVNYNANGGSGSVASSRHTYGIAKALTANGFLRTGYNFAGWAISADGAAVYSDGQNVISLTSKNNATVTLYATWIPVYSLTVVGGSGSGSYEARTRVSIAADASPAGKVFDKWKSSGGGTFDNVNNTGTMFTMPDQDVVVTATYKQAAVIPTPSATAPLKLEPISIQVDEATGSIVISISTSSLPEGTMAVKLPPGKIVPIDTNTNVLQMQLSQEDMSEDGSLILIALDEEHTPLGSYLIDVSEDTWQVGSADNGPRFISILIWIVAGALVVVIVLGIMVVWFKKRT